VEVAQYFQVNDVIIGLTIIGIGTSLPELISSFIAVRKNEHELAIGNIVGSNLFNTFAVVGLSGIIQPVHRKFNMKLLNSACLIS
jgi:cation:H+ antiporter